MVRDLEKQARDALDMVTRHGVNGSPVNRLALNYGLEHNVFTQDDIDNAQLTFHQRQARDALDMVTRHGVNGSPVNRLALNYGLEHNVFTQDDIDIAQGKYESDRER